MIVVIICLFIRLQSGWSIWARWWIRNTQNMEVDGETLEHLSWAEQRHSLQSVSRGVVAEQYIQRSVPSRDSAPIDQPTNNDSLHSMFVIFMCQYLDRGELNAFGAGDFLRHRYDICLFLFFNFETRRTFDIIIMIVVFQSKKEKSEFIKIIDNMLTSTTQYLKSMFRIISAFPVNTTEVKAPRGSNVLSLHTEDSCHALNTQLWIIYDYWWCQLHLS